MRVDEIVSYAKEIRLKTLDMIYHAKASHIGGAFSMTDILAVLYSGVLNINPAKPKDENRDRFILSKGHAVTSLYAALAIKGFFSIEELNEYAQDGSRLLSHASHKVPGIEFSTGSLGHGLSVGCGIALAGKRRKKQWRVFVLMSDGELDEGSNWEAFLFAPQYKLDNLIAIIDYNKIQSLGMIKEVLEVAPLKEKFLAFHWSVIEINGHNYDQLLQSMRQVPSTVDKPTVIIAHTIKGKGVDFMENKLLWHYKSPNEDEYLKAKEQIEKSL